jgi:hypothetical protein
VPIYDEDGLLHLVPVRMLTMSRRRRALLAEVSNDAAGRVDPGGEE